jgi:hypothetical protein
MSMIPCECVCLNFDLILFNTCANYLEVCYDLMHHILTLAHVGAYQKP